MGDRVITALVLATTIGLGLDVLSAREASPVEPRRAVLQAVPSNAGLAVRYDELVARADAPSVRVDELEARVDELAHAIAVAEGYFADGPYRGRTLPYRLNNPGALVKPALGAAALPTWKKTGLVRFPTPELGWAALRHQVRLMLTGASGIYAHTDSLISVGDKYADGDANWGVNVATRLGVPPARTLAELSTRK